MDAATSSLLDSARRFVEAWGAGGDAAERELRRALADDVEFHPDGVVWNQALKGPDAVIDALRHAHAHHRHQRYEVVAAAANPADRAAFVAVAWEFEKPSTTAEGAAAGTAAGGGVSRGLSVKELLFDAEGRVRVTRAARQMTEDEKTALLTDPSSCQPADLWAEIVPRLRTAGGGPGAPASAPPRAEPLAQDLARKAAKMEGALEVWDAAWGSTGPESSALPTVCTPNMRVLDGYGLHGTGPSYGLADAQQMVSALRRVSRSSTSLLHAAVNPATGVGFSRWEAEAVERGASAGAPAEPSSDRLGGLDMGLFDDSGRIETLVQFTMRPYPQLKRHAAQQPPAAPETTTAGRQEGPGAAGGKAGEGPAAEAPAGVGGVAVAATGGSVEEAEAAATKAAAMGAGAGGATGVGAK